MAPDEQMAHASSQAFLDSVSELPLSDKERNWYYVDVKTVLGETPIIKCFVLILFSFLVLDKSVYK